jgi:hypothetical protein
MSMDASLQSRKDVDRTVGQFERVDRRIAHDAKLPDHVLQLFFRFEQRSSHAINVGVQLRLAINQSLIFKPFIQLFDLVEKFRINLAETEGFRARLSRSQAGQPEA